MYNQIVYVIQLARPNANYQNMYWSSSSPYEPFGYFSHDIQDAKQYQTAKAALEYALSHNGLNLDKEQFNVLPYVHGKGVTHG